MGLKLLVRPTSRNIVVTTILRIELVSVVRGVSGLVAFIVRSDFPIRCLAQKIGLRTLTSS